MKGKIAFVFGAAVGYVLGARAGRERYEQIKRGAEKLWQTELVQKGVGAARGVVGDRVDELKTYLRRTASEAFAAATKQPEKAAPKKAAPEEEAA